MHSEQRHVQSGTLAQDEMIRAMSPGRRLEVAEELYETAWQLEVASFAPRASRTVG
jgi:hypothetical protein